MPGHRGTAWGDRLERHHLWQVPHLGIPGVCSHLEGTKTSSPNYKSYFSPLAVQSQLLVVNPRPQRFQEARGEVHSVVLIIVWSSPKEAKDWMDFTRASVKFLNGILYYKHCNISETDRRAHEPPWFSGSLAFCKWNIFLFQERKKITVLYWMNHHFIRKNQSTAFLK